MGIRLQLVSHWMACAWMLQAIVYNAWFDDVESTWLARAGVDLDAHSLQSRYIQAMYFSITIMATIGFGDITPSNGYERTLCIAAMVRTTAAIRGADVQSFLCYLSRSRERHRPVQCRAGPWNVVLRILHHTAGGAGSKLAQRRCEIQGTSRPSDGVYGCA